MEKGSQLLRSGGHVGLIFGLVWIGRDKEYRSSDPRRQCFNVGHYSSPGSEVNTDRNSIFIIIFIIINVEYKFIIV